MEKDEFIIRSYNSKELASRYRISTRTFRRWLKRLKLDLGTRIGSSFSPRQVKIIVDHLGVPFVWLAALALRIMGDTDADYHHDPHQDTLYHQDNPRAGR